MELTSKSYVEITDNLIKSSDVRTPSSVYSTHLCGKLYTPKVPNYHKATVFIPTFFYPHEVYYFLVQLLSRSPKRPPLQCSCKTGQNERILCNNLFLNYIETKMPGNKE